MSIPARMRWFRNLWIKLLEYSLIAAKAEFISIYCPVVQSKTYMIATVFWNKTA